MGLWLYGRGVPMVPELNEASTQASISMPPRQLVAVFLIVIFLLCFSHYTGYKAKLEQTSTNLQIFLFLLPILLIFSLSSLSTRGVSSWLGRGAAGNSVRRGKRSEHKSVLRAGGSPWVVAVLVVVLLVLVSYQS